MLERPEECTRERLLRSACDVFAEKGFHEATIAEICERAGANIAAVNYYFRSKDNLYVEAWRRAFHESLAVHPPEGDAGPDAPAEQRLRSRIFSLIQRVADPKSREFDIIRKELANPTGLLTDAMREAIQPVQEGLGSVIRELLGDRAGVPHVLLCRRSIATQCIHFTLRERQRLGGPAGREPGPPALGLDIAVIADHVYRFSLAGIREVRRQAERGPLAGEEQPHGGVA
jgi:AcrR family transcriptional regulator